MDRWPFKEPTMGSHSMDRLYLELPDTAVGVASRRPEPTWPERGRQAGERACCTARQPGASVERYREITAEMTAEMQSRSRRDMAARSRRDMATRSRRDMAARSRRGAPAGARTRCVQHGPAVPIHASIPTPALPPGGRPPRRPCHRELRAATDRAPGVTDAAREEPN